MCSDFFILFLFFLFFFYFFLLTNVLEITQPHVANPVRRNYLVAIFISTYINSLKFLMASCSLDHNGCSESRVP